MHSSAKPFIPMHLVQLKFNNAKVPIVFLPNTEIY